MSGVHFERSAFAALTGTPKQVEWAERIRAHKLEELEAYYADLFARAKRAGQTAPPAEAIAKAKAQIVAKLNRRTSASWWIDHRESSARGILDVA